MAMDVEKLKEAVRHLSEQERRRFHAWYEEYAADLWDLQIERDIEAGALDELADEALRDLAAGTCTEL
jgi:hypothetical protein